MKTFPALFTKFWLISWLLDFEKDGGRDSVVGTEADKYVTIAKPDEIIRMQQTIIISLHYLWNINKIVVMKTLQQNIYSLEVLI